MLIFFTSKHVLDTANAVKQGFQSILKMMYLLCIPISLLSAHSLLI